MSTPSAGPSRNPIRRMTAAVSNWHHTRRGRSMTRGAYARAYSDARRMDKDFLERIGRADLTPGDLQVLSTAHLQAEYGTTEQVAYAQALDSIVAGRVQAAGPSAPPTRNPIRGLANRYSRWSDVRQGRATLRAGYALAEQSLKRMDPGALQRISRDGVTMAALQNQIETRMDQVIRPELHQNAAPAQVQAQGQTPAQTPGQAPGQAPAQTPAQAQTPGQVPAQAQGQAAPVPGQAQAGPGAVPQAARPTIAQRVGQTAGTVSRWAQTAWSATTTAARQAAQAFTAARQNPEADPRTTEAWNSPGYTGREAQAAAGAQILANADYSGPGPNPYAQTGPEQAAPAETGAQQATGEPAVSRPAANHDVGKHPIVSEQATGEPVASRPTEDQQVAGASEINQPVEVGDPLAKGAASGATVKAQAQDQDRATRAARNGLAPLQRVSPEAVGAAVAQAQAGTGHNQQHQTTRETAKTTDR